MTPRTGAAGGLGTWRKRRKRNGLPVDNQETPKPGEVLGLLFALLRRRARVEVAGDVGALLFLLLEEGVLLARCRFAFAELDVGDRRLVFFSGRHLLEAHELDIGGGLTLDGNFPRPWDGPAGQIALGGQERRRNEAHAAFGAHGRILVQVVEPRPARGTGALGSELSLDHG